MKGPPFSVSSEEVQALYEDHSSLIRLAASDVLESNERFKARGLTSLVESVWRIGA